MTDGFTIEIDEKTKEDVAQAEFADIDQEVENAVEIDLTQLKAASQIFLTELNSLQSEISAFQKLLIHQRNLRKNNRQTYGQIEEYIQGREQQSLFLHSDIPKRFYNAMFTFQRALNAFIGQKVTMIFVYKNAAGEPELYEILDENILKYDVASRSANFVARYSPTQRDLETSMRKLQMDENFNFNITNLKSTFKEVLFRYRCSRRVNNRIVLWQNPISVWRHAFINTEGDINETYATIVLLNRNSPGFHNSNMELNVEEFVYETFNVDNMSGMLQGDVTVGNIEYGIKSARASALSTNQLIHMAKQIQKDATFSKEKLLKEKKRLANRAKTRNKLLNAVEKTVTDDISNMITSLNISRG